MPNIYVDLSGGEKRYRTITNTNTNGQFIIDLSRLDYDCMDALVNFEAVLQPMAAGPLISVVSRDRFDENRPAAASPLSGSPSDIRHAFVPLIVDPERTPLTAGALELIRDFRGRLESARKASRSRGPGIQAAVEAIARQKHMLVLVPETEQAVIKFPAQPDQPVVITIPSFGQGERVLALALANEAAHRMLGGHVLAHGSRSRWLRLQPSRTAADAPDDGFRHELAALLCRVFSFNLPDIPSGLAPFCLSPSVSVSPEAVFELIRTKQVRTFKELLPLLSGAGVPAAVSTAASVASPAPDRPDRPAYVPPKPAPVLAKAGRNELEQLRKRLSEQEQRWKETVNRVTAGQITYSRFKTEVGAIESRLAAMAGAQAIEQARKPTQPPLVQQWASRWKHTLPDLDEQITEAAKAFVQVTASLYQRMLRDIEQIDASRQQAKTDFIELERQLGEAVAKFHISFDNLLEEIHSSKTNRWYAIWLNPSRHISSLETRLLESLDVIDRVERDYLDTGAPERHSLSMRSRPLLLQINREIFHLKSKIVRTDMLATASDNAADDLKSMLNDYSAKTDDILDRYRTMSQKRGHLIDHDSNLIFYRLEDSRKLFVPEAVTGRAHSLLDGMTRLNRSNLQALLVNLQKAVERLERLKTRLIKASSREKELPETTKNKLKSPHFSAIRIHDRSLEEHGGVILLSRSELKRDTIHLDGSFDQGDYRFSKVQISTDYGATWNDAKGLNNWSYQFSIGSLQSYPIGVRVVDTNGKSFELEISPIEIYLEP